MYGKVCPPQFFLANFHFWHTPVCTQPHYTTPVLKKSMQYRNRESECIDEKGLPKQQSHIRQHATKAPALAPAN